MATASACREATSGTDVLASSELVGEFVRGQVPPEDPVQKCLVVVLVLFAVAVSQIKLVGNVKECVFVRLEEFGLE